MFGWLRNLTRRRGLLDLGDAGRRMPSSFVRLYEPGDFEPCLELYFFRTGMTEFNVAYTAYCGEWMPVRGILNPAFGTVYRI
jgi:hypothetical protein